MKNCNFHCWHNSKYNLYCDLLPTFIIKGNATFLLKVTDFFFLFKFTTNFTYELVQNPGIDSDIS